MKNVILVNEEISSNIILLAINFIAKIKTLACAAALKNVNLVIHDVKY